MSGRPQTIQIFLPSGDPRGIRIAEITTRIVRVIDIPRSLVGDFLDMPEARQVGVYYLTGAGENDEPRLYIGQTGELGKRLSQHHQGKDFWNRALAMVSLTNSLTQAHALFLEWQAIKTAKQAGRYLLENGNVGSRPHTPAPLEADCDETFETGRTLLTTLGYPLFEPVAQQVHLSEADELFFCTTSGAHGRGEYTPEGFVVLKGSTGRGQVVSSFVHHSFNKRRDDLIAQGKVAVENGTLLFNDDVLFPSPSAASSILCGRSSNGWVEWKTRDGKTLDEVKRAGNGAA